jgi:hypothetical protein
MATLYAPRIVTDGLVLSLDAADSFSYASNTLDVEYLIVAGGGGGGGGGGGAGAGGVLIGNVSVSSTSHNITVGAGGSAAPNTDTNASNGGNSSAFSLTAIGGGGGNGRAPQGALNGGSGGGGNRSTAGGLATSGQGNNGGSGGVHNSQTWSVGGGGGGAGSIGQNGTAKGTNLPGDGGVGIYINWLNSLGIGEGGWIAGGGGGGTQGSTLGGSIGGIGGGGNGSASGPVTSNPAQSGQINTGGGAGTSNEGGGAIGTPGAGGSGIVIIRYRGPQRASGGAVTTSNGWTIHTFTSSGTFTVGSHIGDLSGNGNNGQLVNGPTFDSANGGSLVFDGVDDSVGCGNGASINFGTGNFTISVWFRRFSNVTGNLRLLSKAAGGDDATASAAGFCFFGGNNSIQFAVNPTAARIIINAASYSLNEWVNVVGLMERSVSMRTYKNANLVASTTAPVGSVSGTTSLFLGNNAGSNLHWEGEISHVQIYNRALTAQEIQQNYNATKGRYGL